MTLTSINSPEDQLAIYSMLGRSGPRVCGANLTSEGYTAAVYTAHSWGFVTQRPWTLDRCNNGFNSPYGGKLWCGNYPSAAPVSLTALVSTLDGSKTACLENRKAHGQASFLWCVGARCALLKPHVVYTPSMWGRHYSNLLADSG